MRFDPGSKVILEVMSPTENDRIECVGMTANRTEFVLGAKLEINLFQPAGPVTMTNMVLWNSNAGISNLFATGDITFNNAQGWANLAVKKSGDGLQIFLSGDDVGVPAVGSMLMVR